MNVQVPAYAVPYQERLPRYGSISKSRLHASHTPGLRLTMLPPSDAYTLTIRQGPERAKVAGAKEKGTAVFNAYTSNLSNSASPHSRSQARRPSAYSTTPYQRSVGPGAVSWSNRNSRRQILILPEITFKALTTSCVVTFVTLRTSLQRNTPLNRLLQALWFPLSIGSKMWTILVPCPLENHFYQHTDDPV